MITKAQYASVLPEGYTPPNYVVSVVKNVLRSCQRDSFEFGFHYYAGPLLTRFVLRSPGRNRDTVMQHICFVLASLPDHVYANEDLRDDSAIATLLSPVYDIEGYKYTRLGAFREAVLSLLCEREHKALRGACCEPSIPSRKRRM
jgi:hypothetical protein